MTIRRQMALGGGLVLVSTVAWVACAPMLRDSDAGALRHVQTGLAMTYKADGGSGPEKEIAKVQYCEIDGVLVAAKAQTADAIVCVTDGGTAK